jgi:hypothetical protein
MPTPPIDLATLRAEDFSPYLNGVFRIHFTEAEQAHGLPPLVELTLSDVQVLAEQLTLSSTPRTGFALFFSGPLFGAKQREYLPQHIYPVEHPTLGLMDIFLVPLGPQAGQMRYQAVFN